MNFNLSKLRDSVRSVNVNVPNLDELRSTLSTGLSSVRENVATNAPRITDTLRAKLGYTPAPTEDTSSQAESSTFSLSSSHSTRANNGNARVAENRDTESQSQGVLAEVREEVNSWCSLSRTQSIQAFAICFTLGILLILLSFMSLSVGNITPFAVFYSFGNVLSFASSFFLVGPRQHLETMSQEGRAIASAIAVISIILTLCAAFWWRIKFLVLLFAITQFCAQFWYSLTYIPYGRTILRRICGQCITVLDDES